MSTVAQLIKNQIDLGNLMSESNMPNTNLYYYVINKVNNRYLDGEQPPNNNVYVNSPLNNDNQSWQFIPLPNPSKKFYIVNKAGNRYLDAHQPPDNNVIANSELLNDNQKWTLFPVSDTKNEYYILNEVAGRYLDGEQPPHNNAYANPQELKNANQTWILQPAALKPTITFVDITYGDAQYPTAGLGKVDIITKQEFQNNGNTIIIKKFSKSVKESSTFEWGLKETLMVGASAEFQADVPFIGSAKSVVKTELTLSAHQTWSKTEEEEYKYEESIQINPNTSVRVSGYMDWAKNYKTPFTITFKVQMTADTVHNGNGYSLSSEEIEKILRDRGCDGEMSPADEHSVLVSIKGEFSGSYGMQTHTVVEPI